MDAVTKRRVQITAAIAAGAAGLVFRYYFPKHGMYGESASSQQSKADEQAQIARDFPSHPWTPPPGGDPGGTNFNGIVEKSKAILDGKPPEPASNTK